MHSVIIPNDKPSLTLLCFLVLTLASTSSWRSTWGAWATSSSDSVLLSTPKTTTATGLDRLKEALRDDDNASRQPEEKAVKYASGLWLSASKISRGSARKKRSSSDFEATARLHHNHHSPWKNSRRSRIHESSAAMSENIVPSSSHEQPQMSDHLRAAGREMAVQMMSKRRGGMGGGRMYDVPQIGKKPVARHQLIKQHCGGNGGNGHCTHSFGALGVCTWALFAAGPAAYYCHVARRVMTQL